MKFFIDKSCYKINDIVNIYLKDDYSICIEELKGLIISNCNNNVFDLEITKIDETTGFIINNIFPNHNDDLILNLYCNNNALIFPFINDIYLDFIHQNKTIIIRNFKQYNTSKLFFKIKNCNVGDIIYLNLVLTNYKLYIYDTEHNEIYTEIFEFNNINIKYIKNINSFAEGCNWNISHTLKVKDDIFTQGYYYIKIINNINKSFYCPLLIIEDRINNILLISNRLTWEAYNTYSEIDKKISFYYFNLDIDIESKYRDLKNSSNKLSLLRPNEIISNEIKKYNETSHNFVKHFKSHLFVGELYMIKWLNKNNYVYNIITDVEIMENNTDLSKYETIIIQCHAEYIPKTLLEKIHNFSLLNNIKILNISGNSFWWRVDYDILNKQIEISKSRIKHIGDGLIGGNYKDIYNKINTINPEDLFECHYKKITKLSCGYKLINNHKIVSNLDTEFGHFTLNSDGINIGSCGWEIDTYRKKTDNSILIASAIDQNVEGDIVLIENNNNSYILTIGSIPFTGSLLIDKNCSKLISNFLNL
jgi:hypothetical protein